MAKREHEPSASRCAGERCHDDDGGGDTPNHERVPRSVAHEQADGQPTEQRHNTGARWAEAFGGPPVRTTRDAS